MPLTANPKFNHQQLPHPNLDHLEDMAQGPNDSSEKFQDLLLEPTTTSLLPTHPLQPQVASQCGQFPQQPEQHQLTGSSPHPLQPSDPMSSTFRFKLNHQRVPHQPVNSPAHMANQANPAQTSNRDSPVLTLLEVKKISINLNCWKLISLTSQVLA